MFKYKCTCRFIVLVVIDNLVREIRPGEIIESANPLDCPYMKLIEEPQKPKRKYTKKKEIDDAPVSDS